MRTFWWAAKPAFSVRRDGKEVGSCRHDLEELEEIVGFPILPVLVLMLLGRDLGIWLMTWTVARLPPVTCMLLTAATLASGAGLA